MSQRTIDGISLLTLHILLSAHGLCGTISNISKQVIKMIKWFQSFKHLPFLLYTLVVEKDDPCHTVHLLHHQSFPTNGDQNTKADICFYLIYKASLWITQDSVGLFKTAQGAKYQPRLAQKQE